MNPMGGGMPGMGGGMPGMGGGGGGMPDMNQMAQLMQRFGGMGGMGGAPQQQSFPQPVPGQVLKVNALAHLQILIKD